ncbi:CDP-alcohol phosphatidyltransferase family protein [Streptomyces polyrhachis]|uniref:CDP-alcohol phosphatidyltransferase family protein n=1 Tax=Streptomyces polyrhachis TaxID=1282885 RepID=A0ABW2GLU5_9ACTN
MTVGEALQELRTAQKSAKGVSLYSRYVNRPLGRLLAALCYGLGLRPNQVTLISAAFSAAALALVATVRPGWGLGLGVYALLALGFAFDSADGQLARLRRESSPAGEWLDHVVDAGKIVAVHAAVLVSWYRFFDLPSHAWLLVPLGFQLSAVLIFCGGLLADKLKPRPPAGTSPPAAAPVSRVRAVALLPADYGVFCAVFLLLGGQSAFRAGYTLLFAVNVLFLCAFLAKWFRELSAPATA